MGRYKRLKAKVENLERSKTRLWEDLQILVKEIWTMKNPPKYKKGEEIEKLLITNIEVEKEDRLILFFPEDRFKNTYTIFDKTSKNQFKSDEEQLLHIIRTRKAKTKIKD